MKQQNEKIAYPRLSRRIEAAIIDSAIFSAAFFGTAALVSESGMDAGLRIAIVLLPLLCVDPVLVSTKGASIGHMLRGLTVQDVVTGRNLSLWKATFRFFVKIVLGLPSLLFVLVTRRYQAFHDILAHSIVVVKDASRLQEHEIVSEMAVDEAIYHFPSAIRRFGVILAYLVISYLLLGAATSVSADAKCVNVNYSNCTSTEYFVLVMIGFVTLVLWIAIVVFGWRGELWGCRKYELGQKPPILGRQAALTGILILSLITYIFLAQSPVDVTEAYSDGDYETAFEAWMPLAEQNDATAQYNLGVLYQNGEGVKQNLETAMHWYLRSGNNGDIDAQFVLGNAYYTGRGVSKNHATAAIWFEKAAAQGHREAQHALGALHQKGHGVPENLTTAVKWYELAATSGLVKSQAMLGMLYVQDDALKNDADAFKWLDLAAKQEDAAAQFLLGYLYFEGRGVPKNLSQTLMLWSIAIDNGHEIATEARDALLKTMSPTEIEEAETLLQNWKSRQQ